jgi:transposase IS66 family protein
MAAALLMMRICVVRVCTTVKGAGYAEHSQFARYTAGANVAARAICRRLHCALVPLQKIPPLAASQRFWPGHRFAGLHLALTCVYLEDGRIQIDNNLVENSIRPSALEK